MSKENKVKVTPLKRESVVYTGPFRVFPYEEVITALEKDVVFVEGVSRQTAHYASKVLSKKLRKKVRQMSYRWKGINGYLFSLEEK